MKRRVAAIRHFLALPALLLAGFLLPSAAAALDNGAPAPHIALAGNAGTVQLEQFAGQVVYLDFWASWCQPCRQSFPWMNEMQRQYRDQGLKVVAINLDAKRADADRFLEQVPAEFTLAFDPQGVSPRIYEVKGMPTSYLIDRGGRIVARHIGFNASARERLEREIRDQLAAGK